MRQTFRHSVKYLPAAMLACALAVWPMVGAALADAVAVTGGVATGEQGDGTMGAAAAAAMLHGPLPANAADVAAKAAANRAYDEAMKRNRQAPPSAVEREAIGGGNNASSRAPAILTSMGGRRDANLTPPDTTGAAGPTRYVQLVNARFGIIDRSTSSLLSAGSLNRLAGFGAGVLSFDPQIIWDPTTNRFYYAMVSVVSSTDNRIAFGFSKSAAPSAASDWCKYSISDYGAEFPDFPKLGDNRYFILIGVNVYDSSDTFLRSDLIAMPKPIGTGVIATCPSFVALKNGRSRIFQDLRDTNGNQVFSPTPANGIDAVNNGYAVARNMELPTDKLWIVPVTGPANGLPTLLATRGVTIPSTAIPPAARQPSFTQRLDTSDTRPTQAVLARNPRRSNALSLWTQQTVDGSPGSQVRYYEIRPDLTSPILQRSGSVASPGDFLFNAAISPDRRVDGATIANGGSFVIGYNVSSRAINPRILMGSSVNGGAVTFNVVKNGAGPYRDFSCDAPGSTCRWGDYSGAAPDPRPVGSARAVALTNQFSPGGAMPTSQANWRTWIWFAAP